MKIIKKLKRPQTKNIKVFTPYSGKVQKEETPGLWVLEKSFTAPIENTSTDKAPSQKQRKSMSRQMMRGTLLRRICRTMKRNSRGHRGVGADLR